ncbi:hypothetical protein ACQCN2_20400 [Brevibacillus ginsengisoli]|uniref:hypothetical protein n=1 Tax=Brevibacillus ginsengisoli TaxID=363854 RepID=UPI003CFACD94
MNHQGCMKQVTKTPKTSTREDVFTKIMYTFYFVYMILLTVLMSSHDWMAAVLGIVWLKEILLIANSIGILLCVYLIIRNKQKAIWIMERMPAWMHSMFDCLPDWMGRYINHNLVRITMVSCDLMLIWMCVGFGLMLL